MAIDAEKKTQIFNKGIKAVEKIQFIALIVLSLILIAGVDLITGKVGWNQINDPYFYIGNLITDAALLLITFGTVYLVLDYMKENDETYIATRKEINDFAISKENIPTILSRFLEQLNRKRKINQYEYNILVKLYKLENQVKWYAYIPIVKWFVKNPNYFTEEEMHLWNFGTEEEKAKSEYCRKRKMYEEQLDPELIERIIDMQYVRYDKVTTGTILSEYYNKGFDKQVNDYVTKSENGEIARFRIPLLILSFGFTFLVTSLVLDGIRINWIAFITIATKLLTITWNIFTSYRYAKKHFKNVTLHDALFRRSIIVEYRKWLEQEANKKTKSASEPKENKGSSQAKKKAKRKVKDKVEVVEKPKIQSLPMLEEAPTV